MKRLQMAALVAGVSVFGTLPALAGEPVVLSHAELDGVTAAGTVDFDTNVFKNVEILKNVALDVDKDVESFVNIEDYLATAEASADAVGFPNVLAETDTFAQVGTEGAFSFSESLAAGSPNPVVNEP